MWIQISSGQGPDECELAVRHLLSFLTKQAAANHYGASILEAVPGRISGNLQSVLLALPAEAKGLLEPFRGTILWKCVSPYRPHHKRKNWFVEVAIFDEPEVASFKEEDVRFEVMRSSGPGGQHVNKTESAVRAIHMPSGLTAGASEERSQYRNKRLAVARLSALIRQGNQSAQMDSQKNRWARHAQIQRGNPTVVFEGADFRKSGL